MRLLNPEEFFYDLNIVANGYWIKEHAPEVYKWLERKVPKYLRENHPEVFLPVTIKKSMMSGIKPRLEVKGIDERVYANTDYDIKDVERGLLFYYKPSVYKNPNAETPLRSLRLSSLVEFLIWVRSRSTKVDIMAVTYEVAVQRLERFEQEKRAAIELERAKFEKDREELMRKIASGEFHPIRIPISEDYVFQLFHTEQEFQQEAAFQKNCIHWLMYPKFCRKHTLIGSIRRVQDVETPWISIELNEQNFSLVQAELDSNQDVPFTEEPVNTLAQYIEANREMFRTLRQEVFNYSDLVRQAKEGAPSSDLRFAVRLQRPAA